MKKLFLSLLAVAALASCSKTESAYVDQDQEIKLAPVASMTTKAYSPFYGAIDGTTYKTQENFGVKAYWLNVDPGSMFDEGETTYLGKEGAVEFTNKGLYWGGTTPYYWPKNGSLRFSAYSPYVLTVEGGNYDKNTPAVTHTLYGDIYEINHFQQCTNTAKTIDLMVAPTSESYNAETAAEKVSVVFEHTQSWITLKVKATQNAVNAFKVKNLTIKNVAYYGHLTADMVNGTKKWDLEEDVANVEVYDNESGELVTLDAVTRENDEDQNGTLGIPQPTTTLYIKFDQLAQGDVPALEGLELNLPLVLDAEGTQWEPGKHYIYTIIFDRDEILINPSVEDWEDVEVNDVPATDNEVATAEEFAAAVNNSSQIRLVDDIELTTNFRLNSSLNIDLNGYTLTTVRAEDNNENRILFRVNDGATLTIGRGTVNAAGYIASANAGGKVVVNNGTYTTTEATLFQANGGQVFITGGKFAVEGTEPTYLLNHIDSQKNTGLIEVSGGTFVNFNPAEASSENPAMNFVRAGYNVISVANGSNVEYTVVPGEGDVTLSAATVATTKFNLSNGTLDGAGNSLSVTTDEIDNTFLVGTTLRFVDTQGSVTIKDVEIDGANTSVKTINSKGEEVNCGIRAIFLNGTGNNVIENVTIKNVTYTINDDSAAKTLVVKNSNLQGWTSYNPQTTSEFTKVTFTKNTVNDLGSFAPQGVTVLTNCHFEDGFTILLDRIVKYNTENSANNTVKFDKCTFGTAKTVITADNIASLCDGTYDSSVVVF